MSAMIGTTWVWKLSICSRWPSPPLRHRRLAGRVEFAEQAAELTGIGLAQEGVKLFDEAGYGGLLVHGLVGQGAELAAQGRDHPAGQVQVALVRVAEVLLDRDQLLLTDEAVPATEGLRVLTRIRVVLGHVLAHDRRRVAGDVEAGLKRFCRRMRAAYSGLMSFQVSPARAV
jgi:hypothetical protein